MAGGTTVYTDTYEAAEALTSNHFVAIDAADFKAKLPSSAAEGQKILGIALHDAEAGDTVLVAIVGSQYLKIDGAISKGDPISAVFAGNKGRGQAAARPTLSAAPTDAEVNALVDWMLSTVAVAEEAGVAGDEILVRIGKGWPQ